MKLLSILTESIKEQIGVGLWGQDPRQKDTPVGRDYTKGGQAISKRPSIVGGGSEPIPNIDKLNDNSINCIDDVLSNPNFKGKWSDIGGFSDRNIGDTENKSEHSFGNALDWHGKGGVGDPVMQELADYLVSNATNLKVKNVIYNYKIWNSPAGWHDYDTSDGRSPHTDHVHVDFIK